MEAPICHVIWVGGALIVRKGTGPGLGHVTGTGLPKNTNYKNV